MASKVPPGESMYNIIPATSLELSLSMYGSKGSTQQLVNGAVTGITTSWGVDTVWTDRCCCVATMTNTAATLTAASTNAASVVLSPAIADIEALLNN
ncbi:hypothetical protein [Thermoproteus sp. CP80]|uniref:hypothetical protein n=1 Tax=Thermoproteus sp. CP80 TaxID=1650659 RepID=UPI001EDFDE2A|nr:hypothetical protein [Thermoproteus sp. CP80]